MLYCCIELSCFGSTKKLFVSEHQYIIYIQCHQYNVYIQFIFKVSLVNRP